MDLFTWQATPCTLSLVVTAVVAAILAIRVRRHFTAPGAKPLALIVLAVALWSLTYAFQLSSVGLAAKLWWVRLKFLGIVVVPAAWLCLALQYTGRRRWPARRNLALLAVHPVVTLALVWTNDLHRFVWTHTRVETGGAFSILVPRYGVGFYLHVVYSYGLLFWGSVLLTRSLVHASSFSRRQTWALLVGVAIPWIGNLITLLGWSPFPHLDLTPLAFTITGLALTHSLLYGQLSEIGPVARDAVIESMGDAVAVLDVQGRIVDLNPAAQQIIGYSLAEAIGRPVAQVFADHAELIKRYRIGQESDTEITLRPGLGKRFRNAVTGQEETQRFYDLRISSLKNHSGQRIGWVVALRDISARKRAEQALHESHDQLEKRVLERTAELAEANEALQAEIAERERMEQQLRTWLTEKDVLLKEIHHRVKNNLQVVSSLLNLQARHIEDPAVVDVFQESQDRIRSMALVHQKLYQSEDLASIDFAEYIRNLAGYLFRVYGVDPDRIILEINADEMHMGIDAAVPCGLIVNELVSNSLKHAFPGGRAGRIRIALRANGDGKFELFAGDDGVGLPRDLDFWNTGTLGLQLVHTLVHQLDGSVELDDGRATAIKITFGEAR